MALTSIDIAERRNVRTTPKRISRWTTIDEFGMLLGLTRAPGETIKSFKARILEFMKWPPGATRQGLVNALSNYFETESYVVEEKKVFSLSLPPLNVDPETGRLLPVSASINGQSIPQVVESNTPPWGWAIPTGLVTYESATSGFIIWKDPLGGYTNTFEVLGDSYLNGSEVKVRYYSLINGIVQSVEDRNNPELSNLVYRKKVPMMTQLDTKPAPSNVFHDTSYVLPPSGFAFWTVQVNALSDREFLYDPNYQWFVSGVPGHKLTSIISEIEQLYPMYWDNFYWDKYGFDYEELTGPSEIETIFDASIASYQNISGDALGLASMGQSYFRGGVGFGDDVAVESVAIQSDGSWRPEVRTGYFYVGNQEYYLFSDKRSITAYIGDTKQLTWPSGSPLFGQMSPIVVRQVPEQEAVLGQMTVSGLGSRLPMAGDLSSHLHVTPIYTPTNGVDYTKYRDFNEAGYPDDYKYHLPLSVVSAGTPVHWTLRDADLNKIYPFAMNGLVSWPWWQAYTTSHMHQGSDTFVPLTTGNVDYAVSQNLLSPDSAEEIKQYLPLLQRGNEKGGWLNAPPPGGYNTHYPDDPTSEDKDNWHASQMKHFIDGGFVFFNFNAERSRVQNNGIAVIVNGGDVGRERVYDSTGALVYLYGDQPDEVWSAPPASGGTLLYPRGWRQVFEEAASGFLASYNAGNIVGVCPSNEMFWAWEGRNAWVPIHSNWPAARDKWTTYCVATTNVIKAMFPGTLIFTDRFAGSLWKDKTNEWLLSNGWTTWDTGESGHPDHLVGTAVSGTASDKNIICLNMYGKNADAYKPANTYPHTVFEVEALSDKWAAPVWISETCWQTTPWWRKAHELNPTEVLPAFDDTVKDGWEHIQVDNETQWEDQMRRAFRIWMNSRVIIGISYYGGYDHVSRNWGLIDPTTKLPYFSRLKAIRDLKTVELKSRANTFFSGIPFVELPYSDTRHAIEWPIDLPSDPRVGTIQVPIPGDLTNTTPYPLPTGYGQDYTDFRRRYNLNGRVPGRKIDLAFNEYYVESSGILGSNGNTTIYFGKQDMNVVVTYDANSAYNIVTL